MLTMIYKEKSLLLIIPMLLIGVGLFVLGAVNNGWQTTLSAFTLHGAFLSDAKDGTAPPDYRFLENQDPSGKVAIQEDIVLPDVLQQATEHRCSVLIKRLDEGRPLIKFDVAYMMVCFDKYPQLFTDFFEKL